MSWLTQALPWLLIGAATGGWWSSRKRVARAVAAANARSAATALAQGGSVVIGSIGDPGRSAVAFDVAAGDDDDYDYRTVIDYDRGAVHELGPGWTDRLRERESAGPGALAGGRVRHPRPPLVVRPDGSVGPVGERR